MSLDTFLKITQTIAVPLLGYFAYILRGIRTELRNLNGRMIDMERWRADHNKQDDERHDAIVDRFRHPR